MFAQWLFPFFNMSHLETDLLSHKKQGPPPFDLITQRRAIPFDEDQFRAEMEDVSLMRELVGVFMEDSQTLLSEACRALAQQDASSLHRAAHALKGMVGNYSAAPALAAVSLLTESARSENLDRAAELLPRTVEEFSLLSLALQHFLKRL